MTVTNHFASLLALMLIALTFYVIRFRYKHKISLGDGGHKDLHNAVRAHANFIEYTPFFLVLFAVTEAQEMAPKWLLILLGSIFLLGRLSHAHSLINVETREGPLEIRFRSFGMIATLGSIAALGIALLF